MGALERAQGLGRLGRAGQVGLGLVEEFEPLEEVGVVVHGGELSVQLVERLEQLLGHLTLEIGGQVAAEEYAAACRTM